MTATTLPTGTASATAQAITDRCRHLVDTDPDRIAVIDRDRSTTIGELWQLAYQRVARRQPAAGAIMLVLAQPAAATIADAFAAWLCHATPLPIPLSHRAKPVTDAITQAAAVAHWCHPWRAHLHTHHERARIWLAGGEPPTNPRLGDTIGLSAGGTALLAAPLHIAAIFEAAVRQLLAGGTVVLEPDFTPDTWLHTAAATHADWAVLAPGQITALLRHRDRIPGWLAVATRALRHVVVPATITPTAAAHLPTFAAATDVTVTTWYHAPAYDGATATDRAATACTAVPGTRLRIVDPAGQPTPPGVAGLIEAASTAGCASLAHRADQPCPPAQQWRTSGDIGTLTPSGRLTIRAVEPLEYYWTPTGERRRSTTLRRALSAHPDIAASTVHVVPDHDGRARAQIRVWGRPGAVPALTASTLATYCAAADTPVSVAHILIQPWPQRPAPAAPSDPATPASTVLPTGVGHR